MFTVKESNLDLKKYNPSKYVTITPTVSGPPRNRTLTSRMLNMNATINTNGPDDC
jgi:hypothetical protein